MNVFLLFYFFFYFFFQLDFAPHRVHSELESVKNIKLLIKNVNNLSTNDQFESFQHYNMVSLG